MAIKLDQGVHRIEEEEGVFNVTTQNDTFRSSFVSVDAGSMSLFFAKALGYAEELILLLVSGGFYYSPKVLNGKVYRVQKGHIPFAAVHGDPDIAAPGRTRFGPTAEVTALLEKGHPSSIIETLETDKLDFDTAASIEKILGDRDVREI